MPKKVRSKPQLSIKFIAIKLINAPTVKNEDGHGLEHPSFFVNKHRRNTIAAPMHTKSMIMKISAASNDLYTACTYLPQVSKGKSVACVVMV